MARTWQEPIDLTNSDEEDGQNDESSTSFPPSRPKQTPVPLHTNVRHLYSDPPALMATRPKQSPVPLPENVRHLCKAAPSDRNSPTSTPPQKPSPYGNPFKSTSAVNTRIPSAMGFGSSASNGHRRPTSSSYVPVYNKTNGDNAGNMCPKQQATKRRKVSVSGKKEIAPTSLYLPTPLTNGEHVSHKTVNNAPRRRGSNWKTVPNPGKGRAKQVPQHLRGNKAPSTSFLNAALKSKITKEAAVEDIHSSEPTAFHIRSMPMDEEEDVEGDSAQSKSPGGSVITTSPKASTRRKSSLANSDDIQMNDSDYTFTAFPFRKSPKKKPIDTTPQEAEIGYSTQTAPSSFVRAADTSADEERDSVISNSTGPGADQHPAASLAPSRIPPKVERSHPPAGRFTEEEDHLLIFLKEVKKLKWKEIIEHFPDRNFGGVQTHYSHKLNKRNKALDPPRLNLPPNYAVETTIDGTIDNENSPRRNCETRDLVQEAAQSQRPMQQPAWLQHQDSFPRDDTSANESGLPRTRPRRNAPQVNYTWPRRNRRPLPDEDSILEDSVVPEERGMSTPLDVDEALEEAPLGPDIFIPVDKPIDMNFERDDASLATSLVQAARGVPFGRKFPYLSFSQRSIIRNCPKNGEWEQLSGRDWQGSIVHVDFNDEEEDIVERAALNLLHKAHVQLRSNGQKRFHKLLKDQPEKKILQLAYEVRRKLYARDQESINAFLEDARNGKLASHPHIQRIGAVRPARTFSSVPKTSTSSMVRQREFGLQSRRGWRSSPKTLSYQMLNNVQDTLGPAYSFTGASGDVHTVAWSPDGQSFAAGAVCVTDPHSMQYNRPNNLLYGDLSNKTIQELGEHAIDRPKTDTGANSTHAMYSSQDPVLYTTISSVAFSPHGDYMFSAGYDDFACIWRTSRDGSQPELMRSLKHRAAVDIMTVGPHGRIATAAKRWTSNAVKVITIRDDTADFTFDKQSYTSSKAVRQPDMNILPTALAFEPNDGRFLLAGFGANSKASESRLDTNGDICLWDVGTHEQLIVHGSGKNVFDVAFNPMQRYQPLFAVGCVAGANVNRGTRSMVRLYDTRGYDAKFSMMAELECAALDMNDVVWCPYDENIILAGCTSGSTYVWDIRRPDNILYILSHGKSLMPLDDFTDREVADTGVRFLSWGHNATRLYSGSSDGVIKVWDVVGSTEDVFIKDLMTVDSGIMSGAFSPDKSKLIIGEVNGTINVLEVGKDDYTVKEADRLQYLSYQNPINDDNDSVGDDDATAQADSGRAIASESLMTGQMITQLMGGFPIYQSVQGPNYDGPYDSSIDAPFLRQQALEFQLNLAVTPDAQCTLPACISNDFSKITFEETGDSGRSVDRIPDELRKQWKILGSEHKTIPGKVKCTDCYRPARPVESTASVGETALCERCSFACFRCGSINKVMPEMEILMCRTCERIWEIGALGYECVKETAYIPLRAGEVVMSPKAKGIADWNERASKALGGGASLEESSTFGDEVNALTDYYLGLAIDRPESPSL